MKSLYKKIGAVALAVALLMGGVFASSKSYAYANNFDFNLYINNLAYKRGFDVINKDYNRHSPSDLKEAASFLEDYGLNSIRKIEHIDSKKLKEEKLNPGMYSVDFGYIIILIGIR